MGARLREDDTSREARPCHSRRAAKRRGKGTQNPASAAPAFLGPLPLRRLSPPPAGDDTASATLSFPARRKAAREGNPEDRLRCASVPGSPSPAAALAASGRG